MGTGKSYWGARWARLHQLDFYDLDTVIEAAVGKTIADIFAAEGETAFRELEKDILHTFSDKDNFILSTGGGTPCFFDNIEWMNNHGLTIFLDTPVPVIKERLAKEKDHRPLVSTLSDEEMEVFISSKLKQRSPFYSQAKVTVYTELITDITFDQIILQHV